QHNLLQSLFVLPFFLYTERYCAFSIIPKYNRLTEGNVFKTNIPNQVSPAKLALFIFIWPVMVTRDLSYLPLATFKHSPNNAIDLSTVARPTLLFPLPLFCKVILIR